MAAQEEVGGGVAGGGMGAVGVGVGGGGASGCRGVSYGLRSPVYIYIHTHTHTHTYTHVYVYTYTHTHTHTSTHTHTHTHTHIGGAAGSVSHTHTHYLAADMRRRCRLTTRRVCSLCERMLTYAQVCTRMQAGDVACALWLTLLLMANRWPEKRKTASLRACVSYVLK